MYLLRIKTGKIELNVMARVDFEIVFLEILVRLATQDAGLFFIASEAIDP